MKTIRTLLLSALCTVALASAAMAPATAPAPMAPPNETVIDAASREDSPPGAIKSYSVRFPYTAEARFTIDRVGRTRDVVITPAEAPTEIREAVQGAVGRWRFWPAIGACRYVEQSARAAFVFEETRTAIEGISYEPVSELRSVPTMDFAWLDAADAGDRRARPRQAPPKLVDPVALKQSMPRYPANASRKAQPGYAFVLFEVAANGVPTKLTASDSWSPDPKLAPLFGKEAVAAVRQWRFKPASLEGVPQARYACQRFLFNMKLGG